MNLPVTKAETIDPQPRACEKESASNFKTSLNETTPSRNPANDYELGYYLAG